MPYNYTSQLWNNHKEIFFPNLEIKPMLQSGPHCVSTCLAMLTNTTPNQFQRVINTQDPISWSKSLEPWNMKLAYCPTDVRKVQFYLPELIKLNDLFTISYYTSTNSKIILGDPNDQGWICGSHIIILYQDQIFDPASPDITSALTHDSNYCHTKRIFRVVPIDHPRGL